MARLTQAAALGMTDCIVLRMTPRRLALLRRMPIPAGTFLYHEDRVHLIALVNCGYATKSESGAVAITTAGRDAEKEWALKLERVPA